MKRRLRGYIFFIFCLIFAFPIMGRADENLDLNSGKVTITEAGTYKFENYEGANKVIVNAPDKEVDITISGLKIDVSKFPNCAFEIQAGTVNLTLEGTNVLKSGNLKAGLQVPEGSTLTIKGDGVLDVTGGSQGAGIGGGRSGAGGTIKILGGTVNANGGSSGAGIGGGSSGAGGSIIIIEGIVNATGGNSGAGIGGGSNGAVGTIKIQGGTVTAEGGNMGAQIGGGSNGDGGEITITGGVVNAPIAGLGAGIGKGYDGKDNGTFSAKNGNAFINVSSISDQSDKENWKGIIFDGYNGQVYGKQRLETNAEIPKGKTLTIKEDQKLTLGKGVTLSLIHI